MEGTQDVSNLLGRSTDRRDDRGMHRAFAGEEPWPLSSPARRLHRLYERALQDASGRCRKNYRRGPAVCRPDVFQIIDAPRARRLVDGAARAPERWHLRRCRSAPVDPGLRQGAAVHARREGCGDKGSGLLVPERVRRVGGPDERDAAVPRLCRGSVQDVPTEEAHRRLRSSGDFCRRGTLARELAAVPGVQGRRREEDRVRSHDVPLWCKVLL
mmetsp:Transcript_25499/g.66243  ORF Transcript_25499/g.66243 Transcript_25499/m.66243 type:complete len:214 (+) Transcript_25499:669-1310(+)